MTTEADVLALLAGIDEHPHDWRRRSLILADACRELGRDAVADALAEYSTNPHTISASGRVLLRACRSYQLSRRDRRWLSHLIRDAS